MLIVIAPEFDVLNEIIILNQLFEAGLECYHLRKPHKNYEEHCVYLNQIDKKYHNRIVVHYYHELVNSYNLKGIHFQEQKRIDHIDNPGHYFKNLNMFGKTISSSFHEIETVIKCDFEFDYHLLSPVFSSISKEGYKGRGFDVNSIDKLIIGMGGVTTQTLPKIFALGFNGVGVLGGVWNTETPVENYRVMSKKYLEINS